MLKVFKYDLEISDYWQLEMPEDACIISIQPQLQKLRLWAVVNPDKKTVIRKFRIAGTGHDITEAPDKLHFLATVLLQSGFFVAHIFEILT